MATCYKSNSQCSNDTAPQVEGSGLTAGCCTYHWSRLLGELNEESNLDEDFLSDYAKIYVMMESKVDVVRCLKKLASQLADLKESPNFEYGAKEGKGDQYVRLSMALAKFEDYCYFPPSHEVFIGFLPSESFQSYISKGLMPKDPGAGLEHGDFTHRLHWHCISRLITNDFSIHKRQKWEKSPLQLYCSLGSAPATNERNNIWFKLLDDNGSPAFRSPDKFHKHVRDGGYGLLSANVSRRYIKRSNEVNRFIDNKLLDVYKASPRQIAAPTEKSPNKTIGAATEYKLRMTQKANDVYSARKTGQADQYVKDERLPVVVRRHVADEVPIATRLADSATKLNRINQAQDFTVYSEALGLVTRKGALSGLAVLKNNPNRNGD